MLTNDDGKIKVPSWALPIIGAVGTFAAGLLVAADVGDYVRPALVPVVGALVAAFGAPAVARNRNAHVRREGEIDGAKFAEGATYAKAVDAMRPPPVGDVPRPRAVGDDAGHGD